MKSPTFNIGDMGSIPGGGTKVLHSVGQILSLQASTREKPVPQ